MCSRVYRVITLWLKVTHKHHKLVINCTTLYKFDKTKYVPSSVQSGELTGCGLSFTSGRGNELVMHAVDSLRFLAIDRFVVNIQGGLPNNHPIKYLPYIYKNFNFP